MTRNSERPRHRVSDLPKGHWMRGHTPEDFSLRPYGEERAVMVLTKAVIEAIEASGLSRKQVAELLGTTNSYISQVLNGSTNMTLKTFGALLWTAGQQVESLRTEDVAAEAPRSNMLYFPAGKYVEAGRSEQQLIANGSKQEALPDLPLAIAR